MEKKVKITSCHSALKMFASYSSSVEGESQACALLDRLLLSVAFLRAKSAHLITSTPERYSSLGTPPLPVALVLGVEVPPFLIVSVLR